MSNILGLRAAVASTIDSLSGQGQRFQGVHAYEHPGEFDTISELKKYAKQTPAVLVSIMRANSETQGGLVVADCVLAAFVLTQDKAGATRDVQAVRIVDNLLHYLRNFSQPDWGVGAQGPQNVIARNLYHKDFDKEGVALWGVFWNQGIELASPTAPALPDFEGIDLTYDISPRADGEDLGVEPEAHDTIELVEPADPPADPHP